MSWPRTSLLFSTISAVDSEIPRLHDELWDGFGTTLFLIDDIDWHREQWLVDLAKASLEDRSIHVRGTPD